MGLAVGQAREGAPRSGSFDFFADRILLPSPAEMRAAARWLRGRIPQLRVAAAAPAP
jgi:hypothetical protein